MHLPGDPQSSLLGKSKGNTDHLVPGNDTLASLMGVSLTFFDGGHPPTSVMISAGIHRAYSIQKTAMRNYLALTKPWQRAWENRKENLPDNLQASCNLPKPQPACLFR